MASLETNSDPWISTIVTNCFIKVAAHKKKVNTTSPVRLTREEEKRDLKLKHKSQPESWDRVAEKEETLQKKKKKREKTSKSGHLGEEKGEIRREKCRCKTLSLGVTAAAIESLWSPRRASAL